MYLTHNIDINIEIDKYTIIDWFKTESPYKISLADAKTIYNSCCQFYENNRYLSPAARIKADFDQLDEAEQYKFFCRLRKKYIDNEP